jgi:hypothetical protein
MSAELSDALRHSYDVPVVARLLVCTRSELLAQAGRALARQIWQPGSMHPDSIGYPDDLSDDVSATTLAASPIGTWKPDLIERRRWPWFRTKAAAAALAAVAITAIVMAGVLLLSRGTEQATSAPPQATATTSRSPSNAPPAPSQVPSAAPSTPPAPPPPPSSTTARTVSPRLVLHRWCAIRSRGHTARRRRRRSPSLGLRGRRLGRPRHHRPSRGQTPPPLTENQNRGAACSAEPLPILRHQRASGGCAWDRGAVVASGGGASCRLLFCHVLQVGRGRSVPRVPAGAIYLDGHPPGGRP